jgi:hypothetical protein
MQNVTVKVEGTTLHLSIDTTQDIGPSSTGKTNMIASSNGNAKVQVGGREIVVGLNVFTKKTAA